jgi:N-acyl-D-amino-acid deacylase
MTYDLLIKNGRIVDGSGAPAFRGDLGICNGKIAAIGKLRANAARIIDADGLIVAPGFVDTHCHYDAQVTWDPICEFSCYHGVTTVIIGNCSLALAPVRAGSEERLAEFLSYVEAIPMETLRTVKTTWETIAEYMASLDGRLGVNVANLIGHTAVRHYVMGKASQERAATDSEIETMRGIVRDGIKAGAIGLSFSRNKGQFDPQGVRIPALWAEEEEIFALSDVLAELGTGVIQMGDGRRVEVQDRLMTRLGEASGRQIIYNSLVQSEKQPELWKKHMALVDEAVKAGIRANPMCTPNAITRRFTMRNTQAFRGVPSWHPILIAADEEKLRAYRAPDVRKKLHQEVVEWKAEMAGTTIGRGWPDKMWVDKTTLPRNRGLEGKSIRELAAATGKGIIDAFLDLAVEENLDTEFLMGVNGSDKDAMAQILNSPNSIIGLSDAGAHVQFQSNYGYSSRLLGYWVREQGIMSLEYAVKRLTFDSASVFGIYDRGLLRPGLAADISVFDADTINTQRDDVVHDLPAGAWRMRQLPTGMHYTIVNGQVLIEGGRHTGALPGNVVKNSLYHEKAGAV